MGVRSRAGQGGWTAARAERCQGLTLLSSPYLIGPCAVQAPAGGRRAPSRSCTAWSHSGPRPPSSSRPCSSCPRCRVRGRPQSKPYLLYQAIRVGEPCPYLSQRQPMRRGLPAPAPNHPLIPASLACNLLVCRVPARRGGVELRPAAERPWSGPLCGAVWRGSTGVCGPRRLWRARGLAAAGEPAAWAVRHGPARGTDARCLPSMSG